MSKNMVTPCKRLTIDTLLAAFQRTGGSFVMKFVKNVIESVRYVICTVVGLGGVFSVFFAVEIFGKLLLGFFGGGRQLGGRHQSSFMGRDNIRSENL